MRILVVAALCVVGLMAPAAADELTPGERQRLLAHLEMTESWLVGEVTGLSPTQIAYKATPDSWSITEVVQHLAIAEPQYWQRVLDSMKQPATTEKLEATDAGILWCGVASTAPTARAPGRHGCPKASSPTWRKPWRRSERCARR